MFDGKHAADRTSKLSAGERRLTAMLAMIIAGDRRFVLRIPDEIGPDPTHQAERSRHHHRDNYCKLSHIRGV